ncbi:hypothetical protein EDB83DRAFT_2323109 [Lactarius deliciosus]|nr:hypothetical protein EDB83DRAFT_2323109 [Lactarius deliciosus]
MKISTLPLPPSPSIILLWLWSRAAPSFSWSSSERGCRRVTVIIFVCIALSRLWLLAVSWGLCRGGLNEETTHAGRNFCMGNTALSIPPQFDALSSPTWSFLETVKTLCQRQGDHDDLCDHDEAMTCNANMVYNRDATTPTWRHASPTVSLRHQCNGTQALLCCYVTACKPRRDSMTPTRCASSAATLLRHRHASPLCCYDTDTAARKPRHDATTLTRHVSLTVTLRQCAKLILKKPSCADPYKVIWEAIYGDVSSW